MSLYRLAALSALAVVGCRTAPVPEPAAPPDVVATATPSDSPARQGVSVHGHWTFDIAHPDGTVDHVEFDNDYTNEETNTAQILTGQRTAGHWLVLLIRTGGGDPPCLDGAGGAPSACVLANGGPDAFVGVSVHKTLEAASGAGTVTLTGAVTVAQDSTITRVQSWLSTCAPTTESPEDCRASTTTSTAGFPYSERNFDTTEAIAVEAGDVVNVRVDYTYAAGS